MENEQSLQDTYLGKHRDEQTPVSIFLVNGIRLTGKIKAFDKYVMLLNSSSGDQLVYKHAISTVLPSDGVIKGAGQSRQRYE